MDFLTILSGFAVGTLVGATGVGGGSLMTPLLVLFFGVAPATAVGTDLLYAAITKSGGAWAHARRKNIDWRVVLLLGAGSIPATLLTLPLLRALSVDPQQYAAVISSTLGIALILTAMVLVFRERLRALAWRSPLGQSATRSAAATVLTGAVLGVLVTMSSVGAGALGVCALFFLYPGLAAARVVGTDIAHAVPLTLVGGLGHAAMGGVDWSLLGHLIAGLLPGVWLGSALSHKLPERLLSSLLAATLALIGGKLVIL